MVHPDEGLIRAFLDGELDEAVRQLDFIIARSESPRQGFAVATALLSRHGESTQVLQAMETLVARYPNNAEAQLAIGRLAALKGQLDRAMTATDAALALQPGMQRAQILKAQVLIRQQRKDEALQVLGLAVQLAEVLRFPAAAVEKYRRGAAVGGPVAFRFEDENAQVDLGRALVGLDTGVPQQGGHS